MGIIKTDDDNKNSYITSDIIILSDSKITFESK